MMRVSPTTAQLRSRRFSPSSSRSPLRALVRVRVRIRVRARSRGRGRGRGRGSARGGVRLGLGLEQPAARLAAPRKLLCPQRLAQLGQMLCTPLAQRRTCATAAG